MDIYQSESSRSPLADDTRELLNIIIDFLKDYAHDVKYVNNRRQVYEITKTYIAGGVLDGKTIMGLHSRIDKKASLSLEFAKLTGLAFVPQFNQLGIRESKKYDGPSFQIQNLRLVNRVGPEGSQVNQVLFTIYQRSGVIFENDEFKEHYAPERLDEPAEAIPRTEDDEKKQRRFEFKGGCTLIFDLDKMQLKYVISKPVIAIESLVEDSTSGGEIKPEIDHRRLARQYEFQYGNEDSGFNEFSLYFGDGVHHITEPFAFLHQH